jgi:hypothetical protein
VWKAILTVLMKRRPSDLIRDNSLVSSYKLLQ